MTKKRRNGGKNRKGRGHVRFIRCSNCSKACPKDKAVSRFQIRNMVEAAAQRDIREASVYEEFEIPKFYLKISYCIACAIHAHIVRCRSTTIRRVRTPPRRQRAGERKPNTGKPAKGLKKSARQVAVMPEAQDDFRPRKPRDD